MDFQDCQDWLADNFEDRVGQEGGITRAESGKTWNFRRAEISHDRSCCAQVMEPCDF